MRAKKVDQRLIKRNRPKDIKNLILELRQAIKAGHQKKFKILSKSIKNRRVELNLTVEDLALYLDRTPGNISKMEKGTTIPTLTTFLTLCEILETTPNDLLDFR